MAKPAKRFAESPAIRRAFDLFGEAYAERMSDGRITYAGRVVARDGEEVIEIHGSRRGIQDIPGEWDGFPVVKVFTDKANSK